MSITDTALRRANLSEAKRSLLEKHLKRKVPAQAAPPREMIPRRGVHSPAPLSLVQQRLWFLTQLKGSPAYYNTAKAFVLEGALDVGALEKALGELVRRHESLRTTFDVVDGEPMQIINPPRPVHLPVMELAPVPPTEREAEAIRLANEEARRPFDLAAEPPCRFRVLRLNEQEHVVLFTIHHLVTDRVSMAVFARELAILYPAFCEGRAVRLPELPIQYADFAAWQREWLRGEVLERQLAFWKKQLTGAPPLLDLPTDRPRPAMRSFRGAKETLILSRELSDALRRLSHTEGVTVFMTLLASLQTLLLRYTGQEDMLTGSPIAGRNRLETESLIGPFVNILGMRVDLSGNPTFRELLRRVREVALGAYTHQDMPFEKLVDELQLELDPSRPPLFQAVLSVTPGNSLKLQNLHFRPLPIAADTAKFDLLLRLTDAEPGLTGALEYNGDLFDRETIVRLLASFQTLLESVVADPERRLLDLPLLTETERRRLLVEWNDTAAPFDKELCVHDLVARRAEQTPDAVAAVFDKTELTCAELNRQANRLAHHLNTLGVGPESRVGIYMPGSPELLIGLLAILKAGAGYVWIDPQHSPEHIAFLLQDTRAKVLLTLETLMESLTQTTPKIVCVDAEAEAVARQSEENPRRNLLPQNLACVVYTGGSAGQPKGVELTHEGLLNLVQWQQRELALRPAARVAQLEGVSANASRWELWVALAGGATLIWPSDEMARARPVEIRDWIVAEEIEHCFAPTRLTETLCSLPWPDEIRLRVLVTEGERLYRQPAHPLPFSLLHLGTAVESTVVMASGRLAAGEIERRARPAARPIANKKLYLLSEDLQPVPVGAFGELYVGGTGQARGYLNESALTAEKFIPDPFGTEPGGRLYRTGLSARYLADGRVELRGRTDEKLTLNGFPVDPREVEAALLRHPSVEEVFVTSYVGRQTQETRLGAYITLQADSIEELPGFLRGQLPQYMLPQKMVRVRSLPRTPTGEIDHSALPAPEPQGFEVSGNFIQPRDWLEYRLSLIWGEVLGIEPVGIEDNFFELGGHSLLALCLLARIRHLLGTQLPLTTLLQYPTIGELTTLLHQQRVASSDSPLVKLQSAGHAAPFFCVHPAGGSALSYIELTQHLGTDRPFYGLQAAGWDGEQLPEACVEELAAQYLEAVRTVQPAGPYLLGGWSAGGIIAFEMAQQLEERGERVALLALLDSQLPRRGEAGHGDADLIFSFAQNLGLRREHVHPAAAGLGQLSEDEQVRHVFERARGAGILASDAELPMVRHLFRVYKANVRATESYVPRAYSGKITLFHAGERAAGSEADPLLGWGGLAAQGVESRLVPGTHRSMFRAPHVQVLAEQLKACINAADRV